MKQSVVLDGAVHVCVCVCVCVYADWGALQQIVYQPQPFMTINQLKQAIVTE